jgi:ribosomal-protein-alanine N-acetyltransferase
LQPEPFQPLETARLHLRCVVAHDAAATSALMTPAVSRWVAYWPVPFTADMARSRIEAARRLAYAGDALPFGVIEKASGAFIGWVMLDRDRRDRRRGVFGYWLGEKFHGNGYMRELAGVVIEAGFRLLDLDVIEAGAQPGNAASFAVMRGCAMTPAREGMVYAPARKRDEFCQFYEIRRKQ